MYKYMNESHYGRIKRDYATKVLGKRIFHAWRKALAHFKRKRIIKESADLMHSNSLLNKAVAGLKNYTERKQKNRLIVKRFQERQEMGTKVEVLLALYDNIEAKKEQRSLFY